MNYARDAALRLVCAIQKNVETCKDINAWEAETLQALENPQKWSELSCGSRAKANREYLVAKAKKNEFAQSSAQRLKDIAVLTADVGTQYEAWINALQNEKKCWELLGSLYNDWEKENSKAVDFPSFLDQMADYLKAITE